MELDPEKRERLFEILLKAMNPLDFERLKRNGIRVEAYGHNLTWRHLPDDLVAVFLFNDIGFNYFAFFPEELALKTLVLGHIELG
jgi:hypothetical protein